VPSAYRLKLWQVNEHNLLLSIDRLYGLEIQDGIHRTQFCLLSTSFCGPLEFDLIRDVFPFFSLKKKKKKEKE
jgi:hypothetical protein